MIEQKPLQGNPRSTVGTVTEIYTYLRLLFSRLGSNHTLSAGHFSFNSPLGACQTCKGLGFQVTIDPNSFIDFSKSLNEGAVNETTFLPGGRYFNILQTTNRLNFDKPLKDYSKEDLDFLLYSPRISLKNSEQGFIQSYSWAGIITHLIAHTKDVRGISQRTISRKGKIWIAEPCSACGGSRLNKNATDSKINEVSIADLIDLSLDQLIEKVQEISSPVAKPLVDRISKEATALVDVGVGYLTLNRSVDTLSAGESQRLKLARELGSDLIEMTYVLDEPTVGLHVRDTKKLIGVIKGIRNSQNTVILVEHDKDVICTSDHVIEIGPKGGKYGGEIVSSGTPQELIKNDSSLTGRYLSGKEKRFTHTSPRLATGSIALRNASLHNIHNLDIDIPTGVFTTVTGVSGSGKSTLIQEILIPAHPKELVAVDQSPVGANSRGSIATYSGVWGNVRQQLAQEWSVSPSLLSFNSKGACPDCKGLGYQTVNMHFLADMRLRCEECQGKRYQPSVLQYSYKGRDISQILDLTAVEAQTFFDNDEIAKGLEILVDVGLDYLKLGQTLDTLSGGEAQRLKLAKYLQQKSMIYTLDEPTTGLHPYDVDKILRLLHRLVDNGNTVIVIEHNMDVIASSDWVIDMGPDGGDRGGHIVFEGTPEDLIKHPTSYTGKYLKEHTSYQKREDA